MSISEMIETIEGTLDDIPPKYVASLVDFLIDDTEWTLQNISDGSKKKIMEFTNKVKQAEIQKRRARMDWSNAQRK